MSFRKRLTTHRFLLALIVILVALGVWFRKESFTQVFILRTANTPQKIELLFVGDIMLSREIGHSMQTRGNWNFPFERVAETLQSADLAFGNLEGPMSTRGINLGSIYFFRADPRAIKGLQFAGFDVLSVANNHIWDYGKEAFEDTLLHLKEARITPVGGAENYAQAHKASIREVKGIKIGFLGYTNLLPKSLGEPQSKPTIAWFDPVIVKQDIAEAKRQADIVIVSIHWGNEYELSPTRGQEIVAHELIDSGALLVIGHHPHVVQKTESYHGGYIAYSLGNFVFDQNFSEDTGRGLMVRIILADTKVVKTEQLPLVFNTFFQPSLAR